MATLTWHSPPEDFIQISQEALMQYLLELNNRTYPVHRIAEKVLLKIGVSRQEFQNQSLAWDLFNGKDVTVAKPFRFFEDSSEFGFQRGYFLMEYLQGPMLQQQHFNDETVIRGLISAVTAMHQAPLDSLKQRKRPGPPFGDKAIGFPWGDSGAEIEFFSTNDLVGSLEKRLRRSGAIKWTSTIPEIDPGHFTFCHLDLAPRNILLLKNGNIAILDWASLGIYPKYFELAALSYAQAKYRGTDEERFYSLLLDRLGPIVNYRDAITQLEIVQQSSCCNVL